MFEILAWLLVKHFVCDFPLQSHPFLRDHKGEYGALGGISHALIQGAGSLIVFVLLPEIDIETALKFAALDVVIHYHIDWLKVQVNKKMKLGPNSNGFWILFGFDQLVHHMTYVLIAYLIIIQ